MSTSESQRATDHAADITSAHQGQLDSQAARAVFGRRTAAADASHLVSYLRPGLRMVDFGCGQGSLSLGFARLVAPGEVLGLDRAEASIAQARAEAERLGITNAIFRVADLYEAQLPEASVDVAHFSGVLAYQPDPLAALRVAYRALKPGGLLAVREPQKEGDWIAGPYREVMALFNRVLIEDAFTAAGGDAFIGRRLGTLLDEAGFERVQLAPGYAPALSNVQAVAGFVLARLADTAFTARVVRRGWITAEQLSSMPRAVEAWRDSRASLIAVAECTALGWKPSG
jgi:ubiquinone/menaquinone biosynthesis C-methylase UbiE